MTKIKEEDKTPWIIILTHGKAGKELVKSAEMILGPLKNTYTFSLLPGVTPTEYIEEIEKEIKAVPEGSIVMADLFGGTPSNIAAMLVKNYKLSAVTGVNIAMLIEADSLRNTFKGEDLAQKIILAAKNSCKSIIQELKKRQK